jgi:hypothetical protein
VIARRIGLLALMVAPLACADGEGFASQEGELRQDSLSNPTDTGIDLKPGLWHDNVFVPGEGWHLYHFTPEKSGWVTFQMQAPPGHDNLWSYLRIVDPDHNNEVWASVGNRRTNLCEVIVHVDAGHTYDVIVTSQENSLLAPGATQETDGPYTVAVSPLNLELEGAP